MDRDRDRPPEGLLRDAALVGSQVRCRPYLTMTAISVLLEERVIAGES